jgi:hypothetical protein
MLKTKPALLRPWQIGTKVTSDRIVADLLPLLVDRICLAGPYPRVASGYMKERVGHHDFVRLRSNARVYVGQCQRAPFVECLEDYPYIPAIDTDVSDQIGLK